MIASVNNVQNTPSTVTTQASSQLGRDAFLRLLITELSNQDPMSPMEDKEFISQLAQFSSLEQSATLNQNMQAFIETQNITNAAALVGKTVSAINPDMGEPISGKVDGVILNSGEVSLKIGENMIPVRYITSVY